MKTSDNGRLFIEAFEGKFMRTYDDGTGVLTIGYGHTSAAGLPKVVRGQTITAEQCDRVLANDLAAVEVNVSRLIKVPMTQAQFDALVSFDFNTGALGRSSIDDKINAGNSTAAMSTLLMYDHAGGRRMEGLTRRRQAERLMFTGQVTQALKLAGVHAANLHGSMPQAPTRPPIVCLPNPNPIGVPPGPSVIHPAKGSIGAFVEFNSVHNLPPERKVTWLFGQFRAFFGLVAGGVLIWFGKVKIQQIVIGANALSAKLHAEAEAIADGGQEALMLAKAKAFCLNSLTIAWGYLLAFGGA